MSNLYDSDIPEEVLGWFHEQEEIFAIFKRWYGTELVVGGDLPARLWQYFKISKLILTSTTLGMRYPHHDEGERGS